MKFPGGQKSIWITVAVIPLSWWIYNQYNSQIYGSCTSYQGEEIEKHKYCKRMSLEEWGLHTSAVDLDWWKKTVIYQIYPKSFQDSNGDGVGDILGIISRLDHFTYLGVEAVWISPMYKSPMVDNGYDISNYTDIDPMFGSLDDFDVLVEELHKRNIKLIMDFIPNHTSNQHPWFLESKRGGSNNKYGDYYIWMDPKYSWFGEREPPNHWLCVVGGSAWEWVEERGQYYYHQYDKAQPDLNYRNPEVRKEMENVLRFWLRRGVDGIRVDSIRPLYENCYEKDEPVNYKKLKKEILELHEFWYWDHIYTHHQPEIHETVCQWRGVLDEYGKQNGKYILMVVASAGSLDEAMKYYHSGSDMPSNFNLYKIKPSCGGKCIYKLIDDWMKRMPHDKWPNFLLGSHDKPRITTRKGLVYADVMNMLLLLLPGTPTTYQGEEIGQGDIWLSYENTKDSKAKLAGKDLYEKYTRDPSRAPMQWSSDKNAGFSSSDKTWLPVHPHFTVYNVQDQMKNHHYSHLRFYRDLLRLRKEPSFSGNILQYAVVNKNIFSFIRHTDNTVPFLVILNVGSKASANDYTPYIPAGYKSNGFVQLTTDTLKDSMTKGCVVDLTHFFIERTRGIVVRLVKIHQPGAEEANCPDY